MSKKINNKNNKKINYKATNIEIIYTWRKSLEKEFIIEFPTKINLLEKTKIIKKNILYTLDMAENLAHLSEDKNIFDTSASISNIEKEIDKIKKDIISIAVFGQMSSGKSSFLNALVGEELLSVAQERATATITIIRHIDNFEGKKEGDIEIHYKNENELLKNIKDAITTLDKNFSIGLENEFLKEMNIKEIIKIKDNLIEKLKETPIKTVKRECRKRVKESKKVLELILNSLEENIKNIGQVLQENRLNNDILISSDKSVFLNYIIFYKDIKLLKNIELIDTPGLGSNSQLDTRKSEEFIRKSDIVMILTDAKEPMQKESEEDILHILEDIQSETNKNDFFDKVFIVINKIDDSENNREEILELLNESLEDAEIVISDTHKLFISAKYEYLKRCKHQNLKTFHIENFENIEENDLEKIEKTIYNFSAAESTSKFLQEQLIEIDNIFNEVERNFELNIKNLDTSIKETEAKINKFKKNKEKIEDELNDNLRRRIKDNFRKFKSMSYNCMDDKLKEVSTEKYFSDIAKEEQTFKSANTDNTSLNNYTTLAKDLMINIINSTNKKIKNNIAKDIFNDKNKLELKKLLKENMSEIQKKYENDYRVALSLNKIKINSIEILLDNNIDMEIDIWKSIKQFFNLTLWGSEDKYIDISAEKWEEYAKGEYKKDLKEKITNEININEKKLQEEINNSIHKILKNIDRQLQQELKDKKRYLDNKDETVNRKNKIKEEFKLLQINFIDKAKNQNQNLFL